MDCRAAGARAARGHRDGQPGTGPLSILRQRRRRVTDVACRLLLAIACVDHATGQPDGMLADEAVVRLERIQAQAGRLPPLLSGWCTAAHAVADLAGGRCGEAIDRVRTADPSAYPDVLGRIV